MTTIQILLPLTFVYGTIYLLALTKLFDNTLQMFFDSLFNYNKTRYVGMIMNRLQILFFYFSLVFQSWYWLFNK